MKFVVVMMSKSNIERLYDYYDAVADRLYHKYQKSYLEGMNEAFNLLLDDAFEGTYEETDIQELRALRDAIANVSFEREDIRKGIQLGMLKGYKHAYRSNAEITPDTIGIFIAYLIRKLCDETSLETIIDPLVGSGNLVFTVANHLTFNGRIHGVDNDLVKCHLARNLGDLMEYDNEMFYQDSLTFMQSGYDLMVCDLPITDQDPYPPYQLLNHHLPSLKPGAFAFAVIENDFFARDGNDIFKQEIEKHSHVFGLVKLSDSLFQTHPKSILIFRRKGPDVTPLKEFMLVDLPSFNDHDGMEQTIAQIDRWIAERKDDLT